MDGTLLIEAAIAALLPVALSAGVYWAEQRFPFQKWDRRLRQLLIGLLYGGAAILATIYGIPVKGAVLNVRNAAPLTAGLLFGAPAGLLAGFLGGIYRWFWGVGDMTRLACTIGCFFAGISGAICRQFMFDNKKASWFYGLAIGITTEVAHMLLVFVTNLEDIFTVFPIVEVCALPMILGTGVSVMLSLLVVARIGRESLRKPRQNRQISQIFQFLLLICVLAAFAATSLFTNALQTKLAYTDTDKLLELNLEDVKREIQEASDSRLLQITRRISYKVAQDTAKETLDALLQENDVAEINVVDSNGVIRQSTVAAFVGYDMASGEQSAEFLCLLKGQMTYAQKYQKVSANGNLYRKYAGVALPGGGFVQVGYDSEQFQSELKMDIEAAIQNRHIGKTGRIIICDENLSVIADNSEGEAIVPTVDTSVQSTLEPGVRFTADIEGTASYCMFDTTEGFYLVATLPVSEAMFSRNIAVCILMFMEVIVFAALFAHIYFLIKRLIVDNIHKINHSLALITGGNLNVHVSVRENEEFASLSDDINATVDTLKHYIAEAESRIDRELEFARQIQRSSLPSVFPPYPGRTDFSIFASMEAAREVGGDFYDFYLADQTHLTFLVADVSGKGIPGAMFMMRAKTLIKNLAESGRGIEDVFTTANQNLCENNEAEMFVTAWMGRLDLETGQLEYVNAGHNPPLLRRKDGKFEYLRTRPNFILAGMNGTRYKKHRLTLAPGDTVFLYTDGVTEAANREQTLYGEERLRACLSAEEPEALCREVHADIDVFVNGAEQSDDITMLCVRWKGQKQVECFSSCPEEASIPQAAAFLETILEKWEVPMKLANRAQIAMDEIYSNIVYYSKAKNAAVTVSQEENGLILTFEDDGTPYDPTTAKEPDVTLPGEDREAGGLGIFMVKKMAAEMRYERVRDKNKLTVSFSESNKKGVIHYESAN